MIDFSRFKPLIISGIIGNVLEWFEFSLYGSFAPLFAELFFPSSNYAFSMLQIFSVFAAGFLMRPLGGIIFGYLGDRYGRQKTLSSSILLMAIPTTCIGLLPTYASVGALAGILLLTCRLTQGLAVGGEMQGSAIYIVEQAAPHQRGFQGSWTKFGIFLGIFLGSCTTLLLGKLLQPEALVQWGWRLPFLAGIPLGLLGYYIRHRLSETPYFTDLKSCQKIITNPLAHTLRYYWRPTLIVIAMPILIEISFYTIFIFIPSYLTKFTFISFDDVSLINAINLLVAAILLPITGWFSDHFGRKCLLVFSTVCLIIFAYPLFFILNQATSFQTILMVQLAILILIVPFAAITPALFVEMFPTEIRYTASSLAANLAASIFGGTAPLIATWLIATTNNPNSLSWYLIVAGFISLIAVLSLKETYKASL